MPVGIAASQLARTSLGERKERQEKMYSYMFQQSRKAFPISAAPAFPSLVLDIGHLKIFIRAKHSWDETTCSHLQGAALEWWSQYGRPEKGDGGLEGDHKGTA